MATVFREKMPEGLIIFVAHDGALPSERMLSRRVCGIVRLILKFKRIITKNERLIQIFRSVHPLGEVQLR